MEIAEEILADIFNDYQLCVIAACALIGIVLLIIFTVMICRIAGCMKKRNQILERIAKVIEQESEPYVIEKPEKKTDKPAAPPQENK